MKKKDIMVFAGVWREVEDKDIEQMKKNIVELRNRSSKELLKL